MRSAWAPTVTVGIVMVCPVAPSQALATDAGSTATAATEGSAPASRRALASPSETRVFVENEAMAASIRNLSETMLVEPLEITIAAFLGVAGRIRGHRRDSSLGIFGSEPPHAAAASPSVGVADDLAAAPLQA
jgi:hypothetical protein